MAEGGSVEVTITARDLVTPVLRRLSRRLWWFRWGGLVIGMVTGAVIALVSFVLGASVA